MQTPKQQRYQQSGYDAAIISSPARKTPSPIDDHRKAYEMWDLKIRQKALQQGRDLEQRQMDHAIATSLIWKGHTNQDVARVMQHSPALHDRTREGKEAYLRDALSKAEAQAQQERRLRQERQHALYLYGKAQQYEQPRGRER